MKIPAYRLHRASGQAVVTIRGCDHYLGVHGGLASREKYRRIISEFLASGQAPSRDDDEPITVAEAMVAYIRHVDSYYVDPDGKPTNQTLIIRLALKVVRAQYGDTPARDFGPLSLKACRAEFIRQSLANVAADVARQILIDNVSAAPAARATSRRMLAAARTDFSRFRSRHNPCKWPNAFMGSFENSRLQTTCHPLQGATPWKWNLFKTCSSKNSKTFTAPKTRSLRPGRR